MTVKKVESAQKALHPLMGRQQALPAGALWQAAEQDRIVTFEPAVESLKVCASCR
jgi:hypothetical protein